MSYKDEIVKLRDTMNVPVQENGSPMVKLDDTVLRLAYLKQDMVPLLGTAMYARREVAEKLYQLQQQLDQDDQKLQLSLAYAYRAPAIQEKYYQERMKEVREKFPDLPEDDQVELAHSMVAHPSTAGHTTGGAVDITLWDRTTNTEIDMGSAIAEFGDIAYTMYPDVTPEQHAQRLRLQTFMMSVGFAPFLGEWWHFSYGDKEWAFYYKQSAAIFSPVDLQSIQPH